MMSKTVIINGPSRITQPIVTIETDMMEQLTVNWDDLKIFLAIALGGSARAAASKLGVHHSTITRRIDAFECGPSNTSL